jgi:hypothetical protein
MRSKEFLEKLWLVRFAFDRYLVKWLRNKDQSEHLRLRKLGKNGDSLIRETITNTLSNFEQLQAMLYHSQQLNTQYWLSPFLKYLVEARPNQDDALKKLEHIDNQINCVDKSDTNRQQRSRRLLENIESSKRVEFDESINYHSNDIRYWLYKIEYVLYKNRGQLEPLNDNYRNKLNTYRITSKSSIEHIQPQSGRENEDWIGYKIHGLGNLALVSGSENSALGDKGHGDKRAVFDRNEGLLSLKLALIYSYNNWNGQNAEKHKTFIVKQMEDYHGVTIPTKIKKETAESIHDQ